MEDLKIEDVGAQLVDVPVEKRAPRIVKEIDVFLSPCGDGNTKLYLLQYPLRPSWRPYGIEERCQEVRVRPAQSTVEMDLTIDVYDDSYDNDAPEPAKIKTQTLTSTHSELTTSYAVGIYKDNQLHLTPLHAVTQLRPSLKYLDAAAQASTSAGKRKRGEAAADVDVEEGGEGDGEGNAMEERTEDAGSAVALEVKLKTRETEEQEEQRLQSFEYIHAQREKEPWIPLMAYAPDSDESAALRSGLTAMGARHRYLAMKANKGMGELQDSIKSEPGVAADGLGGEEANGQVASLEDGQGEGEEVQEVPFQLGGSDYLHALVGAAASSSSASHQSSAEMQGTAGLSRSYLDTLPLDHRLHALLSRATAHVFRLDRLLRLLPQTESEAEVLAQLQQKALLVQGCWVCASLLRYPAGSPVCIIRDFLLLRFTQSRIIQRESLEQLTVPKELLRELLLSLAVQRGSNAGWEFLEGTDRTFLKCHPGIVREQQRRWSAAEAGITRAALSLNLPSMAHVAAANEAAAAAAEARRAPNHGGRFGAPSGRGSGFGAPQHQQQREGVMTGRQGTGKGQSFMVGRGMVEGQGRAEGETEWGDGGDGSKEGRGRVDVHMSEETRQALPEALRAVFAVHPVCTLQFLCQCLRESAIAMSASTTSNPKAVAAAVAAAKAAAAPPAELAAAVSEVASSVNDVYFRSSLGDPSLDPFREVLIALLRAKAAMVAASAAAGGPGMGVGLKKGEIMEAAKIALKADVAVHVYQKVLKELCYSRGASWLLKPGDGRPV